MASSKLKFRKSATALRTLLHIARLWTRNTVEVRERSSPLIPSHDHHCAPPRLAGQAGGRRRPDRILNREMARSPHMFVGTENAVARAHYFAHELTQFFSRFPADEDSSIFASKSKGSAASHSK